MTEEAIFTEAIEKRTPQERAAFLNEACGDDVELRARVEGLLKAHDNPDHFLDDPLSDAAATIDHAPVTECAGATIGPYKLREQLGEGGMGVVFVAEQERPVRRKVALKIIKPGMDTNEVVARFEAERQALALMDHPNIAKVLDAGSTESGRPYFVMELVRGIPITGYCDQAKLTIRERLELFIQVCQAIQHAHQKGIIHRDVKPSNVLVTQHDGKPVPKVIDFGVAKATNQRLTERTIYTRFAQIIGTPMYMSPEQAELNGLDVDTRSDVYSLGVLLYELLTGTTPFDKTRFEKAAYDEIRRIVRQEEPPKPSTKISTLGERAMAVSAHRRTDLRSLSKFVMGDLDIIAMKALEKDRTRRYDTASGLAADVQRFLQDEPIVGRPPSLAYRFTKFARRNSVAVVTAALVLMSLVAGITATSWMATVARREQARAEAETRRAEETLQMLAEACYESALTAVLAGDRKADKALEIAEHARVSPLRLAILRGLKAVSEIKLDESLRQAEEARKLSLNGPESERIGVNALVALASFWGGDLDRLAREVDQLRRLSPATDTDCLLVVHALQVFEPLEALSCLEERPALLRLPAGILARGAARIMLAVSRRDAEIMDHALRDLECVLVLQEDNQCALAYHTLAIAWSTELARLEGRVEDAARYAERGRPSAARLSAVADGWYGDAFCGLFYRALGDTEKAAQAFRRTARILPFYLGADCLRRQDSTAALVEYDRILGAQHQQDKYAMVAKAYMVPDLPDRAQRVHRLVDDLVNDPNSTIQSLALTALCLIESRREVEKRARAAIGPVPTISLNIPGLAACNEFLAGRLTEQLLLDTAANDVRAQCYAHYTLGMMRLAERNREQAHQHFSKCVATNMAGNFHYEMGRAYFERMEVDPTWPQWIRDNDTE